jgi:DNA-binding NtrC family response regulator
MAVPAQRPTRILVADDSRDTCHYIRQHLRMEVGLSVSLQTAHDRDSALERLRSSGDPFDIVIADLWMPDADNVRDEHSGLKILAASRALDPPAEVIIITGNSSAETALRASATGAREYIVKPIDYERLLHVVRQIVAERSLPPPASPTPPRDDPWTPIIGASPAMIEVMKTVGRVGPTDVDVLITGESGVGKDLVARAIHAVGVRRAARFVPVNCSAIADNLMESELFGIGRRVATDVDAHPGRFMEANGGTLFLDEVGEIPMHMQPKLLRAIEHKEIQRVGGETLKADVRILAATNANLEDAVRRGAFRRDLYYRLSHVVIRVPPLRERREDIPLLAEYFLRTHVARFGKRILGFDADSLRHLQSHDWPGNVRELQSAIEAAVLLCDGTMIRPDDLPPAVARASLPDAGASLDAFLDDLAARTLRDATAEFERRLIARALQRLGGNVTRTATALGIGRTALHRKMNLLGIERQFPSDDP